MQAIGMLDSIDGYGFDKHARKRADNSCLLPCLASTVCLLTICVSGCSQSNTTSSATQTRPAVQSIFSNKSTPSHCPAQCVSTTVAIAREGLGLDPEEQGKKELLDAVALFESLDKEDKDAGSTSIRVPVEDTIEKVTEGPAAPVVFVHNSGHLYVLLGAIKVNDKLLCQVVHGGESVSLVTKRMLLEGGFQEAWRFEKKEGVAVPIHVGSTVIEIDKLWHNFGETLPDKSLECAFHLKNTGKNTVILDKPIVSCQCTVPDLGEKTKLASGGTLDLKILTKPASSTSLRNSVGLTFYEAGNGMSRRVQLALIGSQRESMEVTPTKLDFGIVVPGKVCSRVVSLREKPTDRFVLKEVGSGDLPLSHNVETTKDSNGLATYRVHLELNVKDESLGEQHGELVLSTDSDVRPKVTIPVLFKTESPLRATPSVISLGTVVVGDAREERVQLVSRSGEPVTAQIECCPEECAIVFDRKKNPTEMVVVINLKQAGIWQGIIKLRAKDATKEQAVAIRCVAYVQAPTQ